MKGHMHFFGTYIGMCADIFGMCKNGIVHQCDICDAAKCDRCGYVGYS